MSSFHHIPVLPAETLAALAPRDGGRYADFTVGGGGHAYEVLRASAPSGTLLAFDRDAVARAAAAERLASFGDRVEIRAARMSEAVRQVDVPLDGWLADIGVSSPQIDDAERGFSFANDGPLDMRMGDGVDAGGWLDATDEDELTRVFREYGEIRQARRLARATLEERAAGNLTRTRQFATLCERVLGRGRKHNPATLPFQALRIAVNDELGELRALLEHGPALLAVGGVAAVITFHSLEDRMVKRAFRSLATPKPLPRGVPADPEPAPFEWVERGTGASDAEAETNPRARTARLRAIRRVQPGDFDV